MLLLLLQGWRPARRQRPAFAAPAWASSLLPPALQRWRPSLPQCITHRRVSHHTSPPSPWPGPASSAPPASGRPSSSATLRRRRSRCVWRHRPPRWGDGACRGPCECRAGPGKLRLRAQDCQLARQPSSRHALNCNPSSFCATRS